MKLVRVRSLAVVSLVAALAAAACGQGNAVLTPTGPSAPLSGVASTPDASLALDASQASAAAVAAPQRKEDKEKGGGKPPELGEELVGDPAESELGKPEQPGKPLKGTRGMLSGFITEVGPLSLTINDVLVVVDDATWIHHGWRTLALADVAIGDHAQARGTTEDGLTLLASEIKVEKTGGSQDGGTVDVEGVVVDLAPTIDVQNVLPGSTCSFTVGTELGEVAVTTTDLTAFTEGLSCETLENGDVVNVVGTLQADGSVVAAMISIVVEVVPVEALP